MRTLLTTKPFVRTYSTDKAAVPAATAAVPERVAAALKAPVEGYNHGADTEAFLDHVLKPQGKAGQYDKRQFAYFMVSSSRFFFSAGIRLVVLRYLYTWSASADVLAVSKIEVDVSAIPRGKTVTLTWRGKPVFVRHRLEAEIEEAKNVNLAELRDPQTDEQRTLDPNWSVLLAICTHLGCVPVTDAGAYNAFFCPCHGSHYDVSGRIRKGPAPLNLEVPKHQFTNGGATLVLG